MDSVTSIGVLGGTGALGRGLASRLGLSFDVYLGSRDIERARAAALSLPHRVMGVANDEAARCDLVVVAVPWTAHETSLRELSPVLRGRLVVDCVNPLGFDDRGPFAISVPQGSAVEQAQELLPDSTVVGAFHHISAELLLSDAPLSADVLVVGDERESVDLVISVVDSIDGLRGVHAGRLRNGGQVEALTANLIAINRRYRVQSGVRVTGLGDPTAVSGTTAQAPGTPR